MAPQPPPRSGSAQGTYQEKPKPVPRRNTIHSPTVSIIGYDKSMCVIVIITIHIVIYHSVFIIKPSGSRSLLLLLSLSSSSICHCFDQYIIVLDDYY